MVSAPLDTDFTEIDLTPQRAPALEGEDLGAEILDEGQADTSQFIFGDNLDQMRTAAIGLVIRHAKTLKPFWTTDEDKALAELRNYAMGVSEGRWARDDLSDAQLAALEADARRIRQIERIADEKVEFLDAATREQIQAFVVEEGWG